MLTCVMKLDGMNGMENFQMVMMMHVNDDAHDDDADAGEGLHRTALLRRHSRNL